MRSVLIVTSFAEEFNAVKEGLKYPTQTKIDGLQVVEGEWNDCRIYLICAGQGRIEMQKSLEAFLERNMIHEVILAGYCGALTDDIKLPESKIYVDTYWLERFKKEGKYVDSSSRDGVTPLMAAAATSSNAELVRSLLRQGAKVDLQDNEGNTALMWVIKSLYRLASSELIKIQFEIIDILKEYKANMNLAGTAGFTPLMITVLEKNEAAFHKILSKTLNLDWQNNEGETALHLAIKYFAPETIISYLLNNTNNIFIKDKNGHTPFMLASFHGNEELMDLFIDEGADLNDVDNNKLSALMHAIICKNKKTVIYLFDVNADFELTNSCHENARQLVDIINFPNILHLFWE